MSVYDVPNFKNPPCAQIDPELFFYPETNSGVDIHNFKYAKQICSTCPYREPCAEYGLHNRVYGVWGGLSENERDQIRKLRDIVPRKVSNTDMLSGIREFKRSE